MRGRRVGATVAAAAWLFVSGAIVYAVLLQDFAQRSLAEVARPTADIMILELPACSDECDRAAGEPQEAGERHGRGQVAGGKRPRLEHVCNLVHDAGHVAERSPRDKTRNARSDDGGTEDPKAPCLHGSIAGAILRSLITGSLASCETCQTCSAL
jgi:hypothetical protein